MMNQVASKCPHCGDLVQPGEECPCYFVQVGTRALRDEKGNFLTPEKIYIKTTRARINPETGLIPEEEQTLDALVKSLAGEYAKYRRECQSTTNTRRKHT